MEKKNSSMIFLVSLVVGGMIVGLGSLSVLTFMANNNIEKSESVVVASEGAEGLIVKGDDVVVGSEVEGEVEGMEGDEVKPEIRPISPEEQSFKEKFFVSAQKVVEAVKDGEGVVATWEDGSIKFVHEFKPNGDLYFRVYSVGVDGEGEIVGESVIRELYCLGQAGSRECWTRNVTIIEGPDTWWRLDEPSLTAMWEFPENRETNNLVEWFLARALSSVNCTAARAETVFEVDEGGESFLVSNTITARDRDGVEYLGDQEMTMVFGNGFDVFRLFGSVKDVETGEVKNSIELNLRRAGVGDIFEQYYPSQRERNDAVMAPPPPPPPSPSPVFSPPAPLPSSPSTHSPSS